MVSLAAYTVIHSILNCFMYTFYIYFLEFLPLSVNMCVLALSSNITYMLCILNFSAFTATEACCILSIHGVK